MAWDELGSGAGRDSLAMLELAAVQDKQVHGMGQENLTGPDHKVGGG